MFCNFLSFFVFVFCLFFFFNAVVRAMKERSTAAAPCLQRRLWSQVKVSQFYTSLSFFFFFFFFFLFVCCFFFCFACCFWALDGRIEHSGAPRLASSWCGAPRFAHDQENTVCVRVFFFFFF